MPRFVAPNGASAVRKGNFSGFDLATISPRNRRFGGIFAMGVQSTGSISVSGTAFGRLRTCERNVQIGATSNSGSDRNRHDLSSSAGRGNSDPLDALLGDQAHPNRVKPER
jgi:hypothetical protein